MAPQKVVVIGSGFAGLSAAIDLAHKGYKVVLIEKNLVPGGRARSFKESGFTFDMGPSWYWMPDVFEKFFEKYGKKPSDYYQLTRLDPSYRVIFGQNDFIEIPANIDGLKSIFDSMEQGSGDRLTKFLLQAQYKYRIGMHNLVYKPGRRIGEFLDIGFFIGLLRLDVFQSFHSHIRKFFKNKKILQLMEFPILFLGAIPQNTPALYSLMNYADIKLGTWYPMGGMYKIVEAMVSLAKSKGVDFRMGEEVNKINIKEGRITEVVTKKNKYEADIVVGGADYNHIENKLIDQEYRSYSDKYWDSRILAPSAMIFYIGLNKKVNNMSHHNLFFDTDFIQHAKELYEAPQWPSNPLFYVCVPSITDEQVAPEGCENLFILIPVAPGLKDDVSIREKYKKVVLNRLEVLTDQKIEESVIYSKSYAHKDFINDYNAFKGNAYGLANTLGQTAILKPSIKSKKVKNLYFTGQFTVPGPGVPPSLISGQVVAAEIHKDALKQA